MALPSTSHTFTGCLPGPFAASTTLHVVQKPCLVRHVSRAQLTTGGHALLVRVQQAPVVLATRATSEVRGDDCSDLGQVPTQSWAVFQVIQPAFQSGFMLTFRNATASLWPAKPKCPLVRSL